MNSVIHCAALPCSHGRDDGMSDALAESQLFGHIVGSFTGARQSNPGFFLSAHEGTLFLDEVGDLPQRLQATLLRALEERAVTPVGTARPIPCDVRLIAATNHDLSQAVAQGRFRGDLYARLAALILELPPLHSRREDVLLLLRCFLGTPERRLTTQLAEALVLYAWPFNVRELIQIAANLQLSEEDPLDLPQVLGRLQPPASARPAPELAAPESVAPAQSAPSWIEDEAPLPKQPLSREDLLQLMQQHHGILARVAAAAGRSRRQVKRWLEQYQIDPAAFER